MPALDQVLTPPASSPATREVLEGVLVIQGGQRYARVDGSSALWGPLLGGTTASAGDLVVIAITQTGRPVAIYP